MLTSIRKYIAEYYSFFLALVLMSGLVVILSIPLSQLAFPESHYTFNGKTKKVTLNPDMPVSGIFTAARDGMSQVNIPLGNSDIRWNEEILFELLDGECRETIATTVYTTWTPHFFTYFPFRFAPLPDSAGRQYCLRATFSSPENRKGDKPYLSATDDPDPEFLDRSFTDWGKGKTYPGQTLFLRPAYADGSMWRNLGALENRLSQYKPALFKGNFLFLALILIVLSGIFGILILRNKDGGTTSGSQ